MLLFTILLPLALGGLFTTALTAIGAVLVFSQGGVIVAPDAIGLLPVALIIAGAAYIPMIWWLLKNWKNLD